MNVPEVMTLMSSAAAMRTKVSMHATSSAALLETRDLVLIAVLSFVGCRGPLGARNGTHYGTSIRIVPSCRDVMNSSPSRLRLMCRSARGTLPHRPLDELLNVTYVRVAAASRT